MDPIYAAGFFDGEGCFQIGSNYQVKVVLTQKKPEVLYRFKAKWGGEVYRSKRIARWGLFKGNDIKRFLDDIVPHLVVKLPDAELARRMLELNSSNSSRPQATNGRYLPNPNNVERESIYQSYKALRKA